ncbi:MAG: DUF5722 domain-containing protein [Akkermansiaceae bacterium]
MFQVLFFLFAVSITLSATPLQFDFRTAKGMEYTELKSGGVEFRTTGNDPHISLQQFEAQAGEVRLSFEYFCPAGVSSMDIYYGARFSDQTRLRGAPLPRAESWRSHSVDISYALKTKPHRLRLDFGRKDGVRLRIRNLEVRIPTASEKRSKQEKLAARATQLKKAAALRKEWDRKIWPAQLTEIRVKRDGVFFTGKTDQAAQLRRFPLWSREVKDSSVEAELEAGDFEIRKNRRGALVTRWAIVNDKGLRLSPFFYPTEISAFRDLADVRSSDLKGMGGNDPHFPLAELVELGVKHITVNLTLHNLFKDNAKKGDEIFKFQGKEYRINKPVVAWRDRLTTFAHKHGITVTAVVLVGHGRNSFAQTLKHPDGRLSGHYVMPDVDSKKGIDAYRAALHFVADRYTRPDAKFGRVSDWIIHNEVNFAAEWTDMGEKAPEVYLDAYVRSMRLVNNITRHYDPHSRVYMSLTHHWAAPGSKDWGSHCTRDLVEGLMRLDALEGDFAWGIAYHPYPQSLWKPTPWSDKQWSNDFDTQLILPINISVLDRWMHRPEMRDRAGRVRPVLLSEQGFNTRDYSQKEQELQAIAYLYIWEQLRGLKSIKAFHNHRWVDHPNEGGLLLGLRKLGENGKRYGEKKLAWAVYKALGTAQESEYRKRYPIPRN